MYTNWLWRAACARYASTRWFDYGISRIRRSCGQCFGSPPLLAAVPVGDRPVGAELLDEHRNAVGVTALLDVAHPIRVDWPSARLRTVHVNVSSCSHSASVAYRLRMASKSFSVVSTSTPFALLIASIAKRIELAEV